MKIEELLKLGYPQSRVSCEDRWLFWDNEWVVAVRAYRARENTYLYRGENLDEAVSSLLGGEKK